MAERMRDQSCSATDPINAILSHGPGAVLVVIAGVEGPSYRPVGATMAVLDCNTRVGTLSSGCIEADISLLAVTAQAPQMIRYGHGSPFGDIELPCGGGLDILLLPDPDLDVLADVLANTRARQVCTLAINIETGAMQLTTTGATGRQGATLFVHFDPPVQFMVFGKGPEASTFAALVQSVDYPNILLSPDAETLANAQQAGCLTQHLVLPAFPEDVSVDAHTAIVLFFHDHEWEPPILASAVETLAFYVGAQGSLRARDARMAELVALGVPESKRAAVYGPMGLIPSARDAKTLAVSVLAEVLRVAMARTADTAA